MTGVQDRENRLLVALDGSDFTFETIQYIRQIPTLKDRHLVLFSVFSSIPNGYWDLQQEAVFRSRVTEIRSWEAQRKREAEKYMADAKQMLLDEGFFDESVEIVIHAMERGVARDISDEAEHGYAAVVMGKRGKSRVKGIVLGSVATKLLQKVHRVPLFMVGKAVRPGRVLIAFDGSEGSMRAVDCVAHTLSGSGYRINLCHVVCFREGEEAFIADAEKFISEAFDEAVDRLVSCGIDRSLISTQILTGAKSRAETLVKEAGQGGYGTIVLGRRGISKINEFLMGAVSNKVIQLARGHAIWVVN